MSPARAPWRVVALDRKTHDRTEFSCGVPALDRYIREWATQDIRRDVARVFVALNADSDRVLGYYSLGAASFQKDSLPASEANRLPHYPVPAALLGRLAVDESARGQGLGAHLLVDALHRVHRASHALAIHAIIVDAKDDTAAAFYRRFGFIPFSDEPGRLFLPMATVRKLVERPSE
jgi:GNAT superfamily N-acetyltransferase